MAFSDADLQLITDRLNDGQHLVPPHMWGGVERYFLQGLMPGDFLTALLSNDLMGAFSRADDLNANNMRRWAMFLYNYAPGGSYGSPDHVARWVARFKDGIPLTALD